MIYNANGVMRWEFDPLTTINGSDWFGGPDVRYSGFGGSSFLSQGFTGGGGDGSGNQGGTPGTGGLFIESQAYRDVMSGRASGISNGHLLYWTGAMSSSGSLTNGEANVELDLGVLHRIPLQNLGDLPLDAYKNWADWGSTAIGGGFKYVADQRTSFYNSGSWVDNLGNVRSTAYAGRAVDSQIGLRSSYLRTTAMYGKYANRAGYVGYAISAAQITYGVYQDGGKFGVRAQVATANVAGGMAGAAAGAWALGKAGGAIGTLIGPEGTLIGAAVGGIVGGIVGGVWGGDIAEDWVSSALNKADN